MRLFEIVSSASCFIALLLILSPLDNVTGQPQIDQGLPWLMAGEVTDSTAILQGRLAHEARTRFEVAESGAFDDVMSSIWLEAREDGDRIVKTRIDGLEPGTVYYYRLVIVTSEQDSTRTGPARFRTAAQTSSEPVSLVVLNCLDYALHYGGRRGANRKVWPANHGPDADLGFPAFESVSAVDPDYLVFAGDNVYYDRPLPDGTIATDRPSMRASWHRLFSQPRFQSIASGVGTYWVKDDHDFRYNDADMTGDRPPSAALGIQIFREQVPVVDPTDPDAKTYRTRRLSTHLQIWLIEGRDHRSPNALTDGAEKTIWGEAQARWLKQTLLASDATFKLIIHPTPMVGPDDAYKVDNHTNPGGFQYERDSFFGWLREHDLTSADGSVYVVTGDRHWQYHSIHPAGVEEFAVGAFVDENTRYGVAPGEPGSTDPAALVEQPYLQAPPSGAFLEIVVGESDGIATASFTFLDDEGDTLYVSRKATSLETRKRPSVNLLPVWTRIGDDEARVDEERGTVSVESAELSPDGKLVVSGSKGRLYTGNVAWTGSESANVRETEGVVRRGQAVKLWRVKNGAEVWSRSRIEEIEAVAFAPDGRHVAAGGEDGLVEILRVLDDTGEVLFEPELVAVLEHDDSIDGLRFSNDGRLLATGDESTNLHIWRTTDWSRLNRVNNADSRRRLAVNQMDFSSNDRIIAAAIRSGEVKLWSLDLSENGEGEVVSAEMSPIRVLEHEAGTSVKSVRISPDDELIAAGASRHGGVWVWRTTGELVAKIPATGVTMEAVAWSPDGRYLFTGGNENKHIDGIGAIRAYDRLNDFSLVMEETVYRQEYLDLSPDGSLLVSSHEDGTVRLWRVEILDQKLN